MNNRSNIRKYALVAGAVSLTAAAAYQIYQADAYGRTRRYFLRLRNALQKYTDAVSTGGEIFASLLADLEHFLHSDGNDIPNSLKQLAKLAQSPEFVSTTTTTVSSIYQGISTARNPYTIEEAPLSPPSSTVDKILDALLSDRGHSLVSVAVSMGAKNMVNAYIDATSRVDARNAHENRLQGLQQEPSATDKLFTFLSSTAGQHLAVMSVAAFATNGMRVYMDKSLDVNFYDDLFSSMSKTQHLDAVKQCISVFARDVVGAYMNTNNADTPQRDGTIVGDAHRLQGQEVEDEEEVDVGVSDDRRPLLIVPHQHTIDTHENDTLVVPQETLVSPAESHASGSSSAGVIPANRNVNNHQQRQMNNNNTSNIPSQRNPPLSNDDLDSDSLLHAAIRARASTTKPRNPPASTSAGVSSIIAAVGKEVLTVSKDPAGREAMASVVGSATKEIVAAMSDSMAHQLTWMWFVFVLVVGAMTAVMIQYVSRMMGSALSYG